jgi:hypothetical protein
MTLFLLIVLGSPGIPVPSKWSATGCIKMQISSPDYLQAIRNLIAFPINNPEFFNDQYGRTE